MAFGTKKKTIEATTKAETVAAVADISLEKVTTSLGVTKMEVSQALANLEGKMIERVNQLKQVEAAITIKEQSLRDLHQIEVNANTLDDLRGQIEQGRTEWELEQERRDTLSTEEEVARQKTRKREEEEYQYSVKRKHQQEEDAYQASIAKVRKEEELRREQLEKSWANREAELASRETELTSLRQQVAQFPSQLKAEIEKNVHAATGAQKRQYENDSALKAKDAEIETKLAKQECESSKQEIARLNQGIADLRVQLTKAHEDARAVAEHALDASSGRQALEAVRSVHERNDQPTGKSR